MVRVNSGNKVGRPYAVVLAKYLHPKETIIEFTNNLVFFRATIRTVEQKNPQPRADRVATERDCLIF